MVVFERKVLGLFGVVGGEGRVFCFSFEEVVCVSGWIGLD